MKHRLFRSGLKEHRCLHCLKIFHNLTPDEAREIDEECTPSRFKTLGMIALDLTSEEIDIVLRVTETPLYTLSPHSPLPSDRDTAQQKGDALATQIEEEWRRRK